jgi:membrane protease subunit HflK
MARGDSTDERVKRGAGRLLRRLVFIAIFLGLLVAWVGATGFYVLQPGEAAVILRLGRFAYTEVREGPKVHLPWPIEAREIVNVGVRQRREFGKVDAQDPQILAQTAMQTSDNNIVHLEFVVQFKIGKAFESRFRVADLDALLADGAQAAMREIVGRNTIDAVLSERRGIIGTEAADLLQEILDRYEAGVLVESIELQEVQPPQAVRAAFDDVIGANQDRNRAINEAEGYVNEVIPKARARASELLEGSVGYRDAKIAVATGEADRFLAILAEYQKAPEITRKRLYLEAMEEVLPDVEKIVIEPGTASILPHLSLGPASAVKP